MEYESVANRFLCQINLTVSDLNDILDYICSASNQHKINYLWRPFLKDPKDDFVLELAVKARSQHIITFNKKDFKNQTIPHRFRYSFRRGFGYVVIVTS